MTLNELTMDNLIKEKISYVVPSAGKTFDKKEDAEKLILDTCDISPYYKFYEVFYGPSTTNKSKRYEKFMMVMTRKTVAIKNEITRYLTETLGLDPIVNLSDYGFGYRDNFIINENKELNTCNKVYEQIQKNMNLNGGMEAGGNELVSDGVGTLHLIKYDGSLIYCGTPTSAKDIFDIYLNFDESNINPDPPINSDESELDGTYIY